MSSISSEKAAAAETAESAALEMADIRYAARRYSSRSWRTSYPKALARGRRHRYEQQLMYGSGKSYSVAAALSKWLSGVDARIVFHEMPQKDLLFGGETAAELTKSPMRSPKRHVVREWEWVPAPSTRPDVAEEFDSLLDEWMRDTRYTSSLHQLFLHPAYLRMIGLGREALPLMLQQLKARPRRWFVALRAVAKEDPAAGMHDVGEAVRTWLEWAAARGIEIGHD